MVSTSSKDGSAKPNQKIKPPKVHLRRTEELKLEGSGLTQPEIIVQVSEKFGCGSRIIYNDFETRANWQPTLQGAINPQDLVLKILNRQEQIYRMASVLKHSSNNPSVQLGALNTMSKANLSMFEIGVLPSLMYRLKVLEQKVDRGVFVP